MNALLAPPAAPAAFAPPGDPSYDVHEFDSRDPVPDRPLTEADYLRIERAAGGRRCEFDGTHRIPMSGTSRRHGLIAKAVERAFDDLIAASGRPLETHRIDLRVRVPPGRYRYPDVFVCPDPPTLMDDEQDTVTDPLAIAEILSPSTAHVDRGAKLAEYRAIPSLTDYLLFSQDEPAIDHDVRVGGGAAHPDEPDAWRLISYEGPDVVVPLAGLGELALGPLYPGG